MNQLSDLRLLIHSFCYAEAAHAGPASAEDAPFRRYLHREQDCAARWRDAVAALPDHAALAIVPIGHAGNGPAAGFERWAAGLLGDRCFILDYPRIFDPPFWQSMDADLADGVVRDLQDALLGQGQEWHKEELDTALQCRGCAGQFRRLLDERGLGFDPASVTAEAWGASFDGCVAKYSANLRRLLGFSRAIEIDYDRTVPDAPFLLDATFLGRFPVDGDLRLFMWRVGEQPVGLFVRTSESLADLPVRVKLPLDSEAVTVLSKQAGRLWPPPREDKTPPRGVGYFEPPQDLVTVSDGHLTVPVNHGMVWRLAKAPAYVFGPAGADQNAFRDLLLAGQRA